MRTALPLGWALLVLAGAWSVRPAKLRRLPPGPALAAAAAPGRAASVAAATAPSPWPRHLVMVVLGVAAAAVWLPAAPLPVVAPALHRVLRRRRREAVERAALAAEVPDVVDLLAVAVAAGLNVRLAVAAVVETAPAGALVEALGQAGREVAAGSRLGDALARIPDRLGEAARPVVAALVDAERYGTPVGPALAQVGAEARRARQRQAEEAARRVPVKLLFPLVTCILPAFGLLAVAPLIAGGLRALRLP